MSAVLRWIDGVNRAHPWSHNDHYRRWVLRQVPAGAARALDVGCGTGNLLRALGRVVPEAYGIDRDPRVAALAGGTQADLVACLLMTRRADEARHAMSAPTTPATETLHEIRRIAGTMLPGATIRRRLFWRYTLTWMRPPQASSD